MSVVLGSLGLIAIACVAIACVMITIDEAHNNGDD